MRSSLSIWRRVGKRHSSSVESNLQLLRDKFGKEISVTNLITQYDELRQISEAALETTEPMRTMENGTRVHDELDRRAARKGYLIEKLREMDPTDPNFIPLTDINEKYAGFLQKVSVLAWGPDHPSMVRELRVRSNTTDNSRIIRGMVDSLYCNKDGIVITETKTTRRKEASHVALRLAYHQALTYHFMLHSLLSSSPAHVLSLFEVTHSGFTSGVYYELLVQSLEKLNIIGLAPYVRLEFLIERHKGYISEVFEIPYDEEVCHEVMQSRLDLLNGVREPYLFRPVDKPQHVRIDEAELTPATLSEKHALSMGDPEHVEMEVKYLDEEPVMSIEEYKEKEKCDITLLQQEHFNEH